MMMRRVPLSKLPYGEGSMFYNKRGDIVYKKMVYLADGSRVRRSVTGATVPECMYLMAEKEDLLLHVFLDNGEKTDFEKEVYYWLENVKKNTLKTQSWYRLESTVRNNIIMTRIGKMKLREIKSKDLQKLINDMNDGTYAHSTIKKVYDALNDFFRYISKRDHIYNPMGLLALAIEEKDIMC